MKVVTICCSSRHRDLVTDITRLLRDAGFVVLPPPLHRIAELCGDGPDELRELAWKGATFAHFNRINTADIVLVANPDHYVGSSTTLELGYAVAQNKLIVAMAADGSEPARTVLFDVILDAVTAEDAAAGLVAIAQGARSGAPSPVSVPEGDRP